MRVRSRVGTFIARTFDMKTDERAWRVGAGGEETVGVRLEKLIKHGWHVLHAVPVGNRGSDIDHVVIGPGGVYTLNTKTHPGKEIWVSPRQVRVDGQPVPYLRNSRFEGERAERLLSEAVGFPVFVRPALVFLTGTLVPNVTIKQRPDDVLILDRMDIPGAFRRAPTRLQPDQIAAIFDAARRSTTWEG
ncbi:MAG TPA: nuclease-related domain-containing protein [Mycobacteriales bacterium]|nr:nuclease-related domain-containing protein [Mycobacteriales bacterium]